MDTEHDLSHMRRRTFVFASTTTDQSFRRRASPPRSQAPTDCLVVLTLLLVLYLFTGEWLYREVSTRTEDISFIKRVALQMHRNEDKLPEPTLLGLYNIAFYHLDEAGDKMVISNDRDLFKVLRQHRIGEINPPLAKIFAVVKPALEPYWPG